METSGLLPHCKEKLFYFVSQLSSASSAAGESIFKKYQNTLQSADIIMLCILTYMDLYEEVGCFVHILFKSKTL